MSASLESLMMSDVRRPASQAPLLGGLLAFIVVGAGGAAAFVLLSTIMISLQTGFAAWQVNAACYAATILPVYLLHRRFSFGSDASHWQALPRYVAVQGMALVLAALFSYVVHGFLSLPTLFASMLVIVLTSGVNFMVLRSWAFARGQMSIPVPA
ncbi:GtrA family protein [Devosia lacusdianchii]|uniref:GtrA family protein n=1 Tax=Devosia lacusdianchii TaxID=2917991 RepID=UPI001F0604E1|nr:GtrA family protein [Devosia sp. JXJ CY 41]